MSCPSWDFLSRNLPMNAPPETERHGYIAELFSLLTGAKRDPVSPRRWSAVSANSLTRSWSYKTHLLACFVSWAPFTRAIFSLSAFFACLFLSLMQNRTVETAASRLINCNKRPMIYRTLNPPARVPSSLSLSLSPFSFSSFLSLSLAP